MTEPLIERPAPSDLTPVLVVAPRGFIYAGLAEGRVLRASVRSGRRLECLALWDSRVVIRYAGAAGGLGGLARTGPLPNLGDEWQRYEAPTPEVRVVEVGDWTLMTAEAWEAVQSWPTYGA